MARQIELRRSWAIVAENDWVLPSAYFQSAPAVDPNRDGLKTLIFATRREARAFLERARSTLKKPRVVPVWIEVTW